MSFIISWDEGALKDLEEFDFLLRKRIIKKIEEFANSCSFHQVKKVLGYERLYRLRGGDYRIIFELENQEIVVLKIGHRKNIY